MWMVQGWVGLVADAWGEAWGAEEDGFKVGRGVA